MKIGSVLFLLLSSIPGAWASHLSGGYIQTKPVAGASLQYEITVVLYLNEITGRVAADNTDVITLCFGDGQTSTATRSSRTYTTSREYSSNVYHLVHTYSGPGVYAIIASLSSRTIVRNITNANDLLFTLATVFTTNTTAVNATPTPGFSAPSFRIGVNQRAILSLAATDPEGDSLVYGLTKALTSKTSDQCAYQPITSYQFPNDVTRQGTFKLNSRTGELVWDAPVEQGVYSIAISLSEYRRGLLLSQTTQEITVSVEDLPGTPSSIPPYESGIEGVTGSVITAIAPRVDDDDITLTAFPNPVDDQMQVIIQTSNPTTATVRILDVNSRQLYELTFGKASRRHEQLISLDSLTPGVYLLQAQVDGRSLVRKIVKR